MAIFALDLATTMGWASAKDAGAPYRSGIVKLPAKHRAETYAALRSWLLRNVAEGDQVWLEEPHHRNRSTTAKLLGLMAIAELHCYDRGCFVGTVHLQTYRAGLLPKGAKRDKAAYMALAREKWPSVRDDNEADALLLLDWVLRKGSSR